jgi:hypothetical protein
MPYAPKWEQQERERERDRLDISLMIRGNENKAINAKE